MLTLTKVDIYIDKVDFFCDNCRHGIYFPYCLVFLYGINDPNRRGFYYVSFNTDTTVVLYACKEVSFSEFMYICYLSHEYVDSLSVEECLNAKTVYNEKGHIH